MVGVVPAGTIRHGLLVAAGRLAHLTCLVVNQQGLGGRAFP